MIFTQYYLDCLSQASYLVGDEVTGQAVVIDPRRDVEEYLADASAAGLTIMGVINTHFHADFVSGHLELARATGAWIGCTQSGTTITCLTAATAATTFTGTVNTTWPAGIAGTCTAASWTS